MAKMDVTKYGNKQLVNWVYAEPDFLAASQNKAKLLSLVEKHFQYRPDQLTELLSEFFAESIPQGLTANWFLGYEQKCETIAPYRENELIL